MDYLTFFVYANDAMNMIDILTVGISLEQLWNQYILQINTRNERRGRHADYTSLTSEMGRTTVLSHWGRGTSLRVDNLFRKQDCGPGLRSFLPVLALFFISETLCTTNLRNWKQTRHINNWIYLLKIKFCLTLVYKYYHKIYLHISILISVFSFILLL